MTLVTQGGSNPEGFVETIPNIRELIRLEVRSILDSIDGAMGTNVIPLDDDEILNEIEESLANKGHLVPRKEIEPHYIEVVYERLPEEA